VTYEEQDHSIAQYITYRITGWVPATALTDRFSGTFSFDFSRTITE
jgi:hypothetical protein